MALRLVHRAIEVLAMALVSVLSFVMVLQVFQRFVMNHSLEWPDELAGLTLVWITFVGAYLLHHEQGHVRLTFVEERMPGWIATAARTIADALVAIFLAVLCFYSIIIVERTWGQTPITLPIPKGLIYTVMPVMSGLMLIDTIAHTPLVAALGHFVRRRFAPVKPDAAGGGGD